MMPVFVGKLVEVRKARHVVGVLILAMQENDNWITLLLVVAFWQMHDVAAGNVVDVDFSWTSWPSRGSRNSNSRRGQLPTNMRTETSLGNEDWAARLSTSFVQCLCKFREWLRLMASLHWPICVRTPSVCGLLREGEGLQSFVSEIRQGGRNFFSRPS